MARSIDPLAKAVRLYRFMTGTTQNELAKLTGIDQAMWYRVENGKINATLNMKRAFNKLVSPEQQKQLLEIYNQLEGLNLDE